MGKTIIILNGHQYSQKITANLMQIEKNGIIALNLNIADGAFVYLHPGSALVTAQQTMNAWSKYALDHEVCYPIRTSFKPDDRFGSDEIFSTILKYQEHFEVSGGVLKALELHASNFWPFVKYDMWTALVEIFDVLDAGEIMIIVSHAPMIEALALYVDQTIDSSPLAELGAYIFTQEKNTILVKRVVNQPAPESSK